MIMAGNMVIQSSTTSDAITKLYYWEIYHLMGDPSLMPWLKQASTMTVATTDTLTAGADVISVTSAPYAFVALTQMQLGQRVLIASDFTDGNGDVTLSIPDGLYAGTYELAVSAQNKVPVFRPITVLNDGSVNVNITNIGMPSTLTAGDSITCHVNLKNEGSQVARHCVISFSTNHAQVPTMSSSVDTIAANASATVDFTFQLPGTALDQSNLECTVEVRWDSCAMPNRAMTTKSINAPALMFTLQTDPAILQGGTTATITLMVSNNGHATLNNANLHFHQPLPQITLTTSDTIINLGIGASTTQQYTAVFGTNLPNNTDLPFFVTLTNPQGFLHTTTLPLSLGAPSDEDFESGHFANFSWQQNNNPWEITTSDPHTGNYCARSKTGLGNNQSSTLTITWTSPVNDVISFYYKVSSENNDNFAFLIDNNPQFMVNGSLAPNWTFAEYPISAGTHTFSFTYMKDYYFASGSDCAWIDDIHFPAAPATPHSIVYRADTICQNATYIYDGDPVSTANAGVFNYGRMLPNEDIEVLELHVLAPTSSFEQISACNSYFWHGRLLENSGLYNDTLNSVSTGCDSIATLALTINHDVEVTIDTTIQSAHFIWNGQDYTETGYYSTTFIGANGCDSVVTLNLLLMTGIETHESNRKLCVYPNPTHDKVFLRWSEDFLISHIEVCNLQGVVCITSTATNELDLTNLSAGLYFIHAYAADGSRLPTVKVVRW